MHRTAVAVLTMLGLLACGRNQDSTVEQEPPAQRGAAATTGAQDQVGTAADANADASALALRNAIALSVFAKGFDASNWRVGRYEDYVTLECAYENTSGRDIRGFRGRLVFTDASGSEIYASDLTVAHPIAAGERATYSAVLKYDSSNPRHRALRNAGLADLTVTWMPTLVLFADGTSLGKKPQGWP